MDKIFFMIYDFDTEIYLFFNLIVFLIYIDGNRNDFDNFKLLKESLYKLQVHYSINNLNSQDIFAVFYAIEKFPSKYCVLMKLKFL